MQTEEKTKAEISRIARELNHFPSENDLEAELAKLQEKEGENTNKSLNLSASKADYKYHLKSLSVSEKNAQQRLKELRSAETQKLSQLKKSNSDCYEAVMYLRSHLAGWRASGRFRAGIHEPAVLTITVHDTNNAVYIERETGSQQLGRKISVCLSTLCGLI